MPCAYKKGFNFECQFNDKFPDDELMAVDGEKWCEFHAPLEDEGENPTEKGKWKDEEILHFFKKISELRKSALAEAGERLNLRGVVFPGKAYFQGAEFPEVDFSHAKFKKDADFSGATFKGSVYFRHTKFYGYETTFREARFEYSTDFRKAEFIGGGADFSEAKFIDDEIYGGGNFFSKAKFIGGDANFRKTKFRKNADFMKVKFKWNAIFTESIFKGGAIFKKARFKWSALFQNAQFSGDAFFQNAQFEGHADFTSPGNNSDIDDFQGKVSFEGREFLGEVSFNNRKFRQETSFKNCTFHKAPRFHDCRLHQETDFTDARFLDTASPGSAMAYRTLKQDMEEKRAWQEQLTFYALEMKSRRQTEKRKFLKFISWLYEATSDYGQRIFRPLAWLEYLFALFTFFYAAYFKGLLELDVAKILPLSLQFSIKQIIRPFGVFGSSSVSGYLGAIPSSGLSSLPLIIAATLQSLLSLILLLLSALAARWRFKIG